MARYGQFCAVARALEVLGERWTLLIVREMLMGATTFTQIRRGLPRLPKATLSTRLDTLLRKGVIEETNGGYGLTAAGVALGTIMRELAIWSTETGAAELNEGDLDAAALTWDIQRRINVGSLPERRVVL